MGFFSTLVDKAEMSDREILREDCELGFGPLKLRKGDNNKQHFRLKQNSQISKLNLKKSDICYVHMAKEKGFCRLTKSFET